MKLRFDVTEDDFWGFQDHFIRHSSFARQLYRKFALWGSPFVWLFGFLVFQRHGTTSGLLLGTLVALVWVGVMLTLHKRGATASRRYMGGTYRKLMEGMLGESDVEIVAQGLRTTSHRGETVVYWDAIDQVATTPTHTFIYIGKAQAIVIPQRRILSGNYPAFMQAFADVYAQRRDHALDAAEPVVAPATVTLPQQTTEEPMVELKQS